VDAGRRERRVGVLDELAATDEGARGLVGAIALAKKAVEVLAHVIRRFRGGTDHGVYPTVLEELLREFYLANVGGALWATIKRETLDGSVALSDRK
jgi:hypothetical protein